MIRDVIATSSATPAPKPGRLPARVALRPDPSAWSDDELMSLQEAASLFWPMGPLTTTSLRTAVRHQKLEVAEIAGKLLTSKRCIERMSRCGLRSMSAGASPGSETVTAPPGNSSPRSVAEYRRMVAEGRL